MVTDDYIIMYKVSCNYAMLTIYSMKMHQAKSVYISQNFFDCSFELIDQFNNNMSTV